MMMLIIWVTTVVIINDGHLNFWRSISKNSYPLGQNMCSNAPTNFYEKSKIISNCDFQHIDKTLKPRPCALFSFQSHLLVKVH